MKNNFMPDNTNKISITRTGYSLLTDQEVEKLKTLKKETGFGSTSIFNFMKKNNLLPKGLRVSSQKIQSWTDGTIKSARPDELQAVIEAYQLLLTEEYRALSPYSANKGRIIVTEALVKKSQTLLKQKRQINLQTFLKSSNAPKGLSTALIYQVSQGKCQSIGSEHIIFLEKLFDFYGIE